MRPMVWCKHELSPEEEQGLVKWINACEDCLFGHRKAIIQKQLKKNLDCPNRSTRLKDNFRGIDSYIAFLKCHPEITFRNHYQLSKQRSLVATGMVINWSQD